MNEQPWSLGERESSVRETMEKSLAAPLQVGMDTYNLLGRVLTAVAASYQEAVPQAPKVGSALLVRVTNDLRASALLSLNGYVLQALSIAATMYETAYTVAWIDRREDRAQRWINHDDPTRPFQNLRDLTLKVLHEVGHRDPDAQCDVEYRVYRQLCMAKHGNPLLQQHYGLHLSPNGKVVVETGPDTSERAVRAGWFALEHAARYAVLAMDVFLGSHAPHETRAELSQELVAVKDRLDGLAADARARWGTEDPSPGRW